MTRGAKIGITLLTIIFSGIFVSICLNAWLTALVRHQLDQNIATADSLYINYGDVRLTVLTGKAWIKDVIFCTDTLDWNNATRPVVQAKADMISLDGINYFDWLVRRKLRLKGFTIVNPSCRTRFNHELERQTGEELQDEMEEIRRKRLEKVLRVARIFIDDAVIDRLTIENASIEGEAINDSLRFCFPELTLSIYDLGYNIQDLVPHYNDSVFHFLFRGIDISIPKVRMHVAVDELKAFPNGVLQIGDVQILATLDETDKEHVLAGVNHVSVGGFDVAKFNTIKCLDVKNIHLYDPYVKLRIDESEQAVTSRQSQTEKEVAKLNQIILKENLEVIEEFITALVVDTVLIHNASLDVCSNATKFKLQANQISTVVYGLGYSLIDEIPYHYNDSVYQFAAGHMDVITPDSALAISTNHIRYNNGGAFAIGKTRIHHIIDRWQLSHLMGDVPATWIDLTLDSAYTSAKNIVQEAFTLEKKFYLDTLYANVHSMSIFRDARFKVKHPYKLPQEHIMQVTYPFKINQVKASVRDVHIEMALTKENIGKLDLGPINMQICNVTPIRNSHIFANATGRMGKGKVKALFDMKVNSNCDWHLNLQASDIDAHHLDSMIYPIVGMTIGCNIHRINADYGGNHSTAAGTICMEYDHLNVHAYKDSNSPFTIVGDLSGLINSASKTLLHKSNPSKPGKEPVAYQIQWKNDPWQNPSLFYIGPLIDGCIKNFLPGLFVNKRVKEDKKSKTQSSR